MTVEWFLLAAGGACAIASLPGSFELALLTTGALLPRRRSSGKVRPMRIAVVVPAHNERDGIGRCVESLQRCQTGSLLVEVVVVADNCTDDTAEVAHIAGARVLVRHNETQRGKGYALDFAFQTLWPEKHDAFLIVDADTDAAPNFLTEMASAVAGGAPAVQCRYLVRNPGDSVRIRLMSVALRAFNVLRPRGRERLGLSCGIFGNGFGMTRETLRAVPYLASSVVEDLEYHLAIVRSGRRVHFVENTAVYGEMPGSGAAAKTQRARWEGGRFRMIREQSAGLLADVFRGRLGSLEPLLDLWLLPLAFHVSLLVIAAATPWWPVRAVGLGGLAIVLFHLIAALAVAGGNWSEVRALFLAPFYVAWKLLMLPLLLRHSQSNAAWVRTARSGKRAS